MSSVVTVWSPAWRNALPPADASLAPTAGKVHSRNRSWRDGFGFACQSFRFSLRLRIETGELAKDADHHIALAGRRGNAQITRRRFFVIVCGERAHFLRRPEHGIDDAMGRGLVGQRVEHEASARMKRD